MEEANEDACIAELFGCKGKKKNNKTKKTAETVGVEAAEDSAIVVAANDGGDASTSSGVRISLFDFSVENFFQDMDTIAKLCREEQHYAAFEQSEIQRISSSVTFLREWRDFKYPSRSIRFAYGLGSPESSEGKNDSAINLPQFSSATVPKHNMRWEDQLGDANSRESSRDFVMNAGGPVWALDWCPRVHEKPDCSIECKFIAVAAHPPGSSYHKMGASLTGRGVIQIWCLLNIRGPDEEVSSLTEERKKRPNKDRGTKDKSTQIKRPRGRPRKNLTLVAVDDTNCETQYVPALAVQVAENSTEFTAPDGNLEKNEEIFPTTNKRKGRPKKNEALNEKSSLIKRPRGRPKKNSNEVTAGYPECENQSVQALVQVPEDSAEFICPDVAHGNCNGKRPRRRPKKNSDELTSADPKCENQSGQALAVQVPEDSAEFLSPDRTPGNCNEYALQQYSVTKGKHAKKAASACNTIPKRLVKRSRLKINSREGKHNQDISQPLLIQGENEAQNHKHCNSELGPQAAACSIPGDVTLPRVVSCLAHNGKVAWDVKWRPTNISDSLCKHRMGYLAVLLGNGSLEVWEVPLPHVLRAIYMHKEGTDPRFIKLEPVFKCSRLKPGITRKSIPLTVEWSVTPSHDYLLAGCHDGTVALWKFSANASSKYTKPVLCFGGDTVPIRTVAWAPFEGDPESSNIIVTAGHEGLKFWDLRLNKAIYGLKQAPRAWFEKFQAALHQLGFVSIRVSVLKENERN
ncbi:uncharacterized protein LOC133302261 [Gastrolobium bilobum]|uniref:uncharacterized protein LOC133302261 n=1 Tax=Gastrolobium bilobum TaxID=150636 RepID=UPI002AAF7399|nr:uncharacterized protein LOC133302261 [Gastrolobium bilobum]